MIPHHHNFAVLHSEHETTCPVQDHQHESPVPHHCHAFNALDLIKATPVKDSKPVVLSQLFPGRMEMTAYSANHIFSGISFIPEEISLPESDPAFTNPHRGPPAIA